MMKKRVALWRAVVLATCLGLVVIGQFMITQSLPSLATAQVDPASTPGMDMTGMDMSDMNVAGTEVPGMDMSAMDINAMLLQMSGMEYASEEDMQLMSSHMQPVDGANLIPAPNEQGGQRLEYTFEDGVKVFNLVARPYLWNILPNVTTVAWTFNGMVPGPEIRVTEGDRVRIIFRNELPEPTTIHWHGIHVPNEMDGVPYVSQPLIQPGETFTYEFDALPSGTFWYHSHYHEDYQLMLGLAGAFIIEPANQDPEDVPDVDVTMLLSERRVMGGRTFPAMAMTGMEPNYFVINGKSHPATPPIYAEQGDRVRLRFIGAGQFIHPMHLHGFQFEVVAIDGMPVPQAARQLMDTISVAPGQRFDIEFIADRAGPWMLQCHIPHHTTNNFRIGMGGLSSFIVVNPSVNSDPTEQPQGGFSEETPQGGFVEPTIAVTAEG